MKQLFFIFIITLLIPLYSTSANIIVEKEINWYNNSISKIDELTSKRFLFFEQAKYDHKKDYLPIYSHQIILNNERIIAVNLIDIKYEAINSDSIVGVSGVNFIDNDIHLEYINTTSRKVNYGEIVFTPIIFNKVTQKYQRVIKYKIEVVTQKIFEPKISNKAFASGSVLETGDWYKIAVLKDGVFKLSYSFLKDLGLDIDNLNPLNFKLYGNGGKSLPAANNVYRADDLKQNAIFVEGELDGSFDPTDYVLFYG